MLSKHDCRRVGEPTPIWLGCMNNGAITRQLSHSQVARLTASHPSRGSAQMQAASNRWNSALQRLSWGETSAWIGKVSSWIGKVTRATSQCSGVGPVQLQCIHGPDFFATTRTTTFAARALVRVFAGSCIMSVATKLKSFWNHPAGPKTIFFWAPTFKWGISLANFADLEKDPDTISVPTQVAITATGLIWSKYSLDITPKNYNLLAVNVALAVTGLTQLYRVYMHEQQKKVLS